MNILETYYSKKHKSNKGYLFLLMQISVITAVIIAGVCIYLKNNYFLVLEIFPLAALINTLKRYKIKHKEDFYSYVAIFSMLFVIALIAPFIFEYVNLISNPFMVIRYLVFIILALVIFFVIMKSIAMKKQVIGKVTLADKNSAVVLLDFDLIGGIKAGEYAVKNTVNAKKGNNVSVMMKKTIIGKTKPEKIIRILR